MNSFADSKNKEQVPDGYAKITPKIKAWIKGIASNAQDSIECECAADRNCLSYNHI